jgi:quercetin dioxygenase-like cupin family protein
MEEYVMHYTMVIIGIFAASVLSAQGKKDTDIKRENMTVLNLTDTIGDGVNKEVRVLFKGPRRTIVQITLRNNGILASHSAPEPITIHCVAGKGTMTVGEEKRVIELTNSVLVTIEPNVPHEIIGEPAVSVLLSKFSE